MTYLELYQKAEHRLIRNEITLGEFEKMIEPLNAEITQLPQGIILCRECGYGRRDNKGRWYCDDVGCQIGPEDGSGFLCECEKEGLGLNEYLISKQDVLDVLHGYFDGMTETDTICPVDVYGEIETIDSKIIHCLNCVFRELRGADWYCDHITGEEIMVRPNDYCSWAEERE